MVHETPCFSIIHVRALATAENMREMIGDQMEGLYRHKLYHPTANPVSACPQDTGMSRYAS